MKVKSHYEKLPLANARHATKEFSAPYTLNREGTVMTVTCGRLQASWRIDLVEHTQYMGVPFVEDGRAALCNVHVMPKEQRVRIVPDERGHHSYFYEKTIEKVPCISCRAEESYYASLTKPNAHFCSGECAIDFFS